MIANIWGACHDETIFKGAHEFKADRFIDAEGKFQKPSTKQLLTFSAGKEN